MGCGASSPYAEDGGVAPGKGEIKLEWDEAQPVEVGFYYYSENSAEIQTKDFPMEKECVDKVFNTDLVASSDNGGMHWIKAVPGTRYAMRYKEGGNSVAYLGQTALNIPKKVHAFHTKDDDAKEKLAKDLKKDVEKEEEHKYNQEGGDDLIKQHIDEIGKLQSCSQFPDEMAGFKKACNTAEEVIGYNGVNAVCDIKEEFGHWDEKEGKLCREMGLADKGKKIAEEKVTERGREVGHKALSTAQKVFKGVVEGAVKGACKKAGPEVEELVVDMNSRTCKANHCVPGVDNVDSRAMPEGEKVEVPAEEGEDPVMDKAIAEYEADKGKLDELKAEDKKDKKGEVEAYLKSTYGNFKEISDPSSCTQDTAVSCNVEGIQVPALVWEMDGDNVKVTTCSNIMQDEKYPVVVPKTTKTNKICGTEAEDDTIPTFHSIGAASDQYLKCGQWVTCKGKGKEYFVGWIKTVLADSVLVVDICRMEHTVAKTDAYTHIVPQQVATQGLACIPNFCPINFWWVAEEDANVTCRKVKVWRFGAPDTCQEYELQAVKAKAKPTKENENPTHEVHKGYRVTIDLLAGAKYAYNFQIGEKHHIAFDKEVSEKGCKVITVRARIEY